MDAFGLGLMLHFVDQATPGMRNATRAFGDMSAGANALGINVGNAYASISQLATTGAFLSMIGDGAIQTGKSIAGAFIGVGQAVIGTGGMFIGYQRQLEALYKSPEKAAEVVQQMKDYAQESVFEIQDLIKSVTMLKVVGIEALDLVASSTGETNQTLMDSAADLAAMIPNIRNTYGTGVAGAMGALKEYIAEGNALTLKRSVGLDIVGLLDEEKGATIEERSKQIQDLIELLGIAGYTQKLFGTPTQVISNLSDYWVNFLDAVSNIGGVYESYASIITKIGDFVKGLVEDTDKYEALVTIVSDVLKTLLDVVDKLVDKIIVIVNAFADWASENPKLVKTITLVIAAISGILIVFGVFSKVLGVIFLFRAAMMAMGVSTSAIFMSIGKSFLFNMLPLIAFAYTLKRVWDLNLGGIQQKVSGILEKIGLIFKGVFVGVSDESGKFADLSEKDFARAKELGLLPLIEGVMDMQVRLDEFLEGFKTGFDNALASFVGFIDGFMGKSEESEGWFVKMGDFMKGVFGQESEIDFVKLGEDAGAFAVKALAVIGGLWAIRKAFTLVKGAVFVFETAMTAAKGAIALITAPLSTTVLAIAGIIVGMWWLYNNSESFRAKMDETWAKLQAVFEESKKIFSETWAQVKEDMKPVIAQIEELWETIQPTIESIIEGAAEILLGVGILAVSIVDTVLSQMPNIISFVASVLSFFIHIVDGIAALMTGDWEGAKRNFGAAWEDLRVVTETGGNLVVGTVDKFTDDMVRLLQKAGVDIEPEMNILKDLFRHPLDVKGGFLDYLKQELTDMISYSDAIKSGVIKPLSFADIFKDPTKSEGAVNLLKDFLFPQADVDKEENAAISRVQTAQGNVLTTFADGTVVISGKATENGESLMADFGAGMTQGAASAQLAASAAVMSAWEDAEKALGVQSPSTIAYQTGSDTMQGLINAFNDRKEEFTTLITELFTGIGTLIASSINAGLLTGTETYFTPASLSIQNAISKAIGTAFGVVHGGALGFMGIGEKGSPMFEPIGEAIVQGIVWGINNSVTLITDALSSVKEDSIFNALVDEDSTILSKWTALTTDIASAVSTMESSILTSLSDISWAFSNLTWKLPKIKLPKVSTSYRTDDEGIKTPKFSVTWNAKGGIFNSPTILPSTQGYQGVGEAGAEAIVPLKELWSEMSTRVRQEVQTASVSNTNVVFETGSFTVQLAKGTNAELEKVADDLMRIIARKTEIKNLATRGRVL